MMGFFLSSRRPVIRNTWIEDFMTASSDIDEADLLQRAAAGDQQALAQLFAHYRDRLRRLVRLRLDRRVAGRVDTSDVLQDAYLDLARRFPEYAAAPTVPF